MCGSCGSRSSVGWMYWRMEVLGSDVHSERGLSVLWIYYCISREPVRGQLTTCVHASPDCDLASLWVAPGRPIQGDQAPGVLPELKLSCNQARLIPVYIPPVLFLTSAGVVLHFCA